jgi:hypothetical protein
MKNNKLKIHKTTIIGFKQIVDECLKAKMQRIQRWY